VNSFRKQPANKRRESDCLQYLHIERSAFCNNHITTCLKMNSDQEKVLKLVLAGHNVLITGQAGTGKSVVVRECTKRLNKTRKNVAVVCSSRIACQVYEPGVASTVHSYYGFQAADIPWKQIISRSAENSLVRDKLKTLDVLIWDEASMSSQRVFELWPRTSQVVIVSLRASKLFWLENFYN
jgi:Cdc6-like AAA superfamily ATPase